MTPEELNQVEAVYERGLDLPTSQRAAYWQSQFHDQPSLRAELAAWIRGEAAAAAAGFLDKAAYSVLHSNHTGKAAAMIGTTIGTYEIQQRIGAGGMGELYLAKDQRLGREVAIKVLKGRLNHDLVERFQSEMRILCKIEHDNVTRLYDGGTSGDGQPYIVMEFLRGFSTLREASRATNGAGLPLPLVKEITRQFCTGLAQAHDLKIVHRDIKPENIMFLHNQDGVRVKVIDFGIAIPPAFTATEMNRDYLTHKPSVFSPGTTVYKSPEQIANAPREAIGATSDVYSFALVIYEMLTGRLYFPDDIHRIHEKHPTSASALRPDIGKQIDVVLQRALHKDPPQRQPNIRALMQEVIAALPNQATLVGSSQRVPSNVPPTLPPTERVTPNTVTRSDLHSAPTILDKPATVTFKQDAAKPVTNRWLWPSLAAVAFLMIAGVLWNFRPASSGVEPVPAANTQPNASAKLTTNEASNAVTKVGPQMTLSTFRNGTAVTGDAMWRNNDVAKFKMSFSENGLLFVLHHGSDGTLSVLYPDRNVNGGKHDIAAQQTIELPPAGSTRFGGWRLDEKNGTETFYLIFATATAAQAEFMRPLNAAIKAVSNEPKFAPKFAKIDLAQFGGWFDQLRLHAGASHDTDIMIREIRMQHQP